MVASRYIYINMDSYKPCKENQSTRRNYSCYIGIITTLKNVIQFLQFLVLYGICMLYSPDVCKQFKHEQSWIWVWETKTKTQFRGSEGHHMAETFPHIAVRSLRLFGPFLRPAFLRIGMIWTGPECDILSLKSPLETCQEVWLHHSTFTSHTPHGSFILRDTWSSTEWHRPRAHGSTRASSVWTFTNTICAVYAHSGTHTRGR